MNFALEIRGLTHAFGDRRVLDRADLALAPGDFMALIGPNGSGKTTLLRCLAGILVPDAGHVLIDGVDIRDDRLAATRRLGFAVDPVLLPGPLTGRQCLQLFATTRELPGVPDSTIALANALAFSPWLDVEVER